ncbi:MULTISPECIES: S24 family peptidase [Aerococcus]|uniref:Helix-turn-helix domain-containing protein n=1 Tax=Aerococcus tenax TaxID=3078812 RepID=A0A329NBD8_9LACT|nr:MULTISPECIES: S24 family peptidase [Aerococcus]MDL5184735.1 S24 family peptidase [Aerococcus mictus]KAA9238607.1 helix-turn-helix domain-containing protein [Aerococcus urinae]MDK6371960.1 S24 family peptidase [Aerococcus urinae]MDK7302401.1 S24 family peptidase [Aerococcus urinae]MDK7802259.1 S24 family peptidase [Aerococcus urinae]
MKVSTGTRLKELMSELGLKQVDILKKTEPFQKSLGIKMGKSTLSQYVNDVQSPDQDRIYLLSKAFNVSEPWLMGYEVDKERIPDNQREENTILDIYNQLNLENQSTVYSFAKRKLSEQNSVKEESNIYQLSDYTDQPCYGAVSAGTGEWLGDETIETVSVPNSILPPCDFDMMLQVNGDSMEPLFEDDEYIFVKKTDDLRSGQIGVFFVDGEAYVKKAYLEEDQLRLVSLNTKYDDLIFKDFNEVKMIGTVIM